MVSPSAAASSRSPDRTGSTGRDGSERAIQATASASVSRSTMNRIPAASIPVSHMPSYAYSHEALTFPGRVLGSGGQAGGRGVQRGLDRLDQGPGRVRGELYRDPRRGPGTRVAEVDVEGVLGLGVHRVVEVHARVGHIEPAGRPLPAAGDRDLLRPVRAHRAAPLPMDDNRYAVPGCRAGWAAFHGPAGFLLIVGTAAAGQPGTRACR